MNSKMELNTYYESISLLYFLQNEEIEMKKYHKEREDSIYTKEEMEKLFLLPLRKYIEKVKRVIEINKPLSLFFFDNGGGAEIQMKCIADLICHLYEPRGFYERFIRLDEQEQRVWIQKRIEEHYEFDRYYIDAMMDSDVVDAKTKWNLTMLVHQPNLLIALMEYLFDVEEKIKGIIEEFVPHVESFFNEINISHLLKDEIGIHFDNIEKAKVSPSFLRFESVVIELREHGQDLEDVIFIGYGVGKLVQKKQEFSIDTFLNLSKILSDRSKVEIIKLLKKERMYGQALATCLQLSTATISYHMNALLVAKLVSMVKEENKVYYTLHLKRLEEYRSLLDELLSE